MEQGSLIVNVYTDSVANPISNAFVEVLNTNEYALTDENGKTEPIILDAPSKEYSMTPQHDVRPFSTYNIRVSKEGFVDTIINNVEIYSGEVARQDVFLVSKDESDKDVNEIDIDDPVLWGDYAPPIVEEEVTTGLPSKRPKVLPRVVVPEYITVHNGIPSNASAANYYVPFVDYIKNVASSEVYSTWPKEAIKANVHAIVSFTLNRVYTEWYRNKGYNFTITSSPVYDQKYTPGRTIYDSISQVVDEYFRDYIKFPNRIEPFLAHYNDGVKVNNDGWLSQWGSKELADNGYTAERILKYYYGTNAGLTEANVITGSPSSFPGYVLQEGMCGEEIQKIQNELNIIRGSYPALPYITPANGEFGASTTVAVRKFQSTFGLPVTGKIDYTTWYKISYYFAAVSKLADSITS